MRTSARVVGWLVVAAAFAFNLAAFLVAGSALNLGATLLMVVGLPVAFCLGRRRRRQETGRRSR